MQQSKDVEITWKTIRRESGLVEHVCYHDGERYCGHPNAGSIQYIDWYFNVYDREMDRYLREVPAGREDEIPFWEFCQLDRPKEDSAWGIHGCCGCCGRSDFPGTAANAIKFAFDSLSEDEKKRLRRDYFQLWWGIMAAMAEAVPE